MNQANQLVDLIRKYNGIPYVAPTIELRPCQNKKKILKILNRIFNTQIDYLIFKSVNAVFFFLSCLHSLHQKENFLKKLNKANIIAIGPKTNAELKNNGIMASLIPNKYNSEGIFETLKEKNLMGKIVVIPQPKKIRNSLAKKLRDFGAKVFTIPVYEITLPKDYFKVLTLIRDIINGKINIITFTSSSSAINLVRVARKNKLDIELRKSLNKCMIAVIGPVTQKTLENLGVKSNIIPKEYTIEAMINSLIKFLNQEREKD
ncbi:hypothetical protein LCGC14_0722430 [marine sediment metagenome]|uniref:Tetrapyrrole biosynthesis uroporphyrinogen III synthase domain-containing protein n=1 Tax=marine sediment metagenome TaxID=412755 RepID=A0A0F9TJ93_9ZZZZ|nr:MAG: uroporphyrinogen-III synthase [Candidatus Lokiarchaeum sp. GC14_75]